MKVVSGLLGFINKDVQGKNETKTIPVMLRAVSVIMMAYYIIFFALISDNRQVIMEIMAAIGLLLFLSGFILTYYEKTQITVIMTHAFVMIWIMSFVYFYGWGCGVQQFFVILLFLGFVTSYSNYYLKCAYAVLLIILRMSLFYYDQMMHSLYPLDSTLQAVFQSLNTLAVFAIGAFVVVIFTRNSLQMEEKLKSYNEQLFQLASVDALTGLKNRRSTMEYLLSYEKNLSKNSDEKLTIAIGDIDFFKRFNDQYGHACGDEVLLQLSAVFMDFMEEQGMVARWGGEEFLLVFENKDENEALLQMEKLMHRIRLMEVRYGGEALRVTMTFGLSQHTKDRTIDATISNADKKLYIGKQSGRNRIVIKL